MRSVAAARLAPSTPAPAASQFSPPGAGAPSPPSFAIGSAGSAISSLFSLYDHFFEQHVVHRRRRNGEIDAAQKLFLEPHHAGRTANVLDAQLAQIGLELVDDARQHRFDGGFRFGLVEFER